MEPIFKLAKTTLQEKSRRFNFTCVDCTSQIIALGTDIGSCHLYSTKTLRPFGQIIYLPALRHTDQSQQKAQSMITACKFSLIPHEKNCICLLIGTASGHIHLYNVDILNCKSFKVQTIQIDHQRIECLLWCKLEKLNMDSSGLNHRDSMEDHSSGSAGGGPMDAFKIIVSVNKGKIYLLHLLSNSIINVQLIYECSEDEIIQTSFKTHFVLVSCITRCFILDFSQIYHASLLAEQQKATQDNKNAFVSLPFVNSNGSDQSYFISIYVVGSRPRNGYYGACFDCQSIDGCDQILSARKSGRIWVGETQSGSVRNTLRFKLPKIPNVFAPNTAYCTADIDGVKDATWRREMEEQKRWNENVNSREDAYDHPVMDGLDYEFANVSETVCQNLGILIPFGNWTVSYVHPKQSQSIHLEDCKVNELDFSRFNKKGARMGYHERLNHFGLRILDHNVPKLLQWYPNMGRVIDIAVLESQCCLYIIYDEASDGGVQLGRIELCSPNESVKALIADAKLNTAVDYLCAYKVRDADILQAIKDRIESDIHANSVVISDHHQSKFAVHLDECVTSSNSKKENKESEEAAHNNNNNNNENMNSKFIKYRRASMDYEAAQKKESKMMKWEPAKFDVVSTAQILNDESESVASPPPQLLTKKFLKMGQKLRKQITQTTESIKADLMGNNSPKPGARTPSGSNNSNSHTYEEGGDQYTYEDVMESYNDANNENEEEEYREPPPVAMDSSVQSIDFQQKQRVARARRKSAVNQQIFIEAAEEEPTKLVKYKKKSKDLKKRSKKHKKKKRKKKKAEFAVIDPGPPSAASHHINKIKKESGSPHAHAKDRTNKEKQEATEKKENDNEITHTAKPGSGSILALDPLIKPHQVIYEYDDVVNHAPFKPDVIRNATTADLAATTISSAKVHQLLRDTERCDRLLRRRMRNELEQIVVVASNEELSADMISMEDGGLEEREFAAVGLSNINYRNCPHLMNEMSVVLGEYESISDLNMKHILFYKWSNKMGEKLSTVLTRMLCVFISVKIDIGKECEKGVIEILRKFLLILDFKWVLKLCNTHKLHATLRQLARLQFEQNEASFNRTELEMAYIEQNYVELVALIDKYASPFLLFQYLPLLCEKGLSHLCYTVAVAYFPHCAPWFVRKYMYRYALDHLDHESDGDGSDASAWNNIFKSYTKYLKLLFNIHPRTRGSGLLVLDLITLTLSLNAPSNHLLFANVKSKRDDAACIIPNGYVLPSRYDRQQIPLIHSENAYSDGLTKYILSIMSDKSYYIEWSYLEIVCKQYGFWRGLYKVYHRFRDVESLILLCVYLDYAQPVLNLLCEQSNTEYWKNVLFALAFVNKNENCTNHRLNYEIVIQYMMRNIGAQETLECIQDPHIVHILNGKIDNIIYRQIVKQKELHSKRERLLHKLQDSLTQYLVEQYSCTVNLKRDRNQKNDEDSFKQLGAALSNIKHSSDEWTVMSSVNVRPPTQRAAAPLEKNLTDLFTQLM